MSVEKGYQHKLLGTFNFRATPSLVTYLTAIPTMLISMVVAVFVGSSDDDMIIETKRMAAAAGGDFVFVPKLVKGRRSNLESSKNGWVIKLDPKVKKKLMGR